MPGERIGADDLRRLLDADPRRSADDLDRAPPLATRTRVGSLPPLAAGILRREGAWTWWRDPDAAADWIASGRCVVQDPLAGVAVELARRLAGFRPGHGLRGDADDDRLGLRRYLIDLGADEAGALGPLGLAVPSADGDAAAALARAAAASAGGAVLFATDALAPGRTQGITHALAGWRLRGETLLWPDGWTRGGYAAVLVPS